MILLDYFVPLPSLCFVWKVTSLLFIFYLTDVLFGKKISQIPRVIFEEYFHLEVCDFLFWLLK